MLYKNILSTLTIGSYNILNSYYIDKDIILNNYKIIRTNNKNKTHTIISDNTINSIILFNHICQN